MTCDIPFATGERLAVMVSGFPHEATVRWRRGSVAGLRFDRPLSGRDVDALKSGRIAGPRRIQGAGHHGFTELR